MKNMGRIVIMVLILILSCSKNTTEIKKETPCRKIAEDVLEPHATGNYWEKVQYSFSGGQIEPGLTDTGRVVIEKIINLEVEGETYKVGFGRVIYPGNFPSEVAILNWNGPEGLYTLGMVSLNDTLVTKPRLFYKYPVDVGEKWSVFLLGYDPSEGKIFYKDTLIHECVAKDEPFVTPIDTFNTIVYHYYKHPAEDILEYWHIFQYITPGVGHVGLEVYSSFDTTYSYENRDIKHLKLRQELIDYCLL